MRKAASALAVISVAIAASAAQPVAARGLSSECVHAGLAPPSLMKAHFYLTDFGPVHRSDTFPHIFYRYRVGALPSQCQGKAMQRIEVKVRYKTSKMPFKTLWVGQEVPGSRSSNLSKRTWMSLYSGDGGTGLAEQIPPSGNMVLNECQPWRLWTAKPGTPQNVFGTVQRVTAIERRSVREVGSGSVWTRTRSLPVTFSPNRLRATQELIEDAGCMPIEPTSEAWKKGIPWEA